MTVTVLKDIPSQIEQFLLIQLITSGIMAVVTGITLSAMGLQQAALWGLLTGSSTQFHIYRAAFW